MKSRPKADKKPHRGGAIRAGKPRESLAYREECAEVFRLRVAGASYRDIARQLGISASTALNRYRAVLDHALPSADTIREARSRQLAEVQLVRERLMRLVFVESDVRAAATLERLWRHELALLGVTADSFSPEPPSVTASGEVVTAVAEALLAVQLEILDSSVVDVVSEEKAPPPP